MKHHYHFLLFILLFSSCNSNSEESSESFVQQDTVNVEDITRSDMGVVTIRGIVEDTLDNELENYRVLAVANNKKVVDEKVSDGGYQFTLGIGKVYTVGYIKGSYINKNIEIDLRDVPEHGERLEMQIDISLFETTCKAIHGTLREPVAKANYNSDVQQMQWDMDYINEKKKEFKAAIKQCEEL